MDKSINTLHSIEEIFARYEELGFYIVPVAHKGKAPLLDPNKYATNSAKQMLAWYNSKKYRGCNWGLLPSKSGCIAIDVDVREGGLELWAELSKGEDINTMTQRSARGGLHFVFKSRPGVKYRKPLSKKGIDNQHNNIIVVFPSKLAEGNQYTWIDESPIQDLPQKFHDMFAATEGEAQEPIDFIGIDKFVEKIAVQLKQKSFGYDEWVQIGMAIHSSLPNETGLKLWKEVSSGVNMKEGDLDQCDYKWGTFTSKGGMTVRSLAFIAREHGCEVPSLTLEQDKLEFATEKQRIALEAEQNLGWFKDPTGRIVSVHADFIIDDLNRQGYFLESEANAGKIGKLNVSDDQYKSVVFMKPADFALQTATHFFKEYKRDDKGHLKKVYTKISKLWTESDRRQSYRKIIFAHKDEPGCLNLWSPMPLLPIKGDVSLFHQLIFDGLANGDLEKGLWLLDWLAHIMQKPQERCSLVPVLLGDQGTGKGMLFDRIMKTLLGHFHNKIMTARTLKERFNAEQACRLLTFIDEAMWRGDREEDGVLKGLTGSKQMTVEHKFGGRYAVDNYSRYAIASNNPEAVAIERSNRRYVVFEVNAAYAHKHGFFKALADQLDEGMLGNSILESLLSRDISNFNPQKHPNFQDGQGHQAKIASEGVIAQFWADNFYQQPQKMWDSNGEVLLKNMAYREFRHFAREINTYEKSITQTAFWRKTDKLLGLNSQNKIRPNMDGLRPRGINVSPIGCAKRFQQILGLETLPNLDPKEFCATEAQIKAAQDFENGPA